MSTQALTYAELPFAPAVTEVKRAWWAVAARFLIHGLVISTWVSRIPSVKGALGLGDGAFGFALLGTAIGSVVSIPVCGWFVAKYGSRTACITTSIGLCVALIFPAFAFNEASLFAALFLFGAMAGSNDVAMNSQAVAVEKLGSRPTMSRFHAMFSLGGIAGACLGGLAAAHAVPTRGHFMVATAIVLFFSLWSSRFVMEATSEKTASTARLTLRHIPITLVVLSTIGFCIFLSEGAIADWTAVYLKQSLNAGPGLAAAGYAVFSLAMAVSRFCGDEVTVKLGPAWTIRSGGILAACGLGSALLVRSPYWALPGFALVGAGFSTIIPLVFAAGGKIKSVGAGAGVATVSGIGYLGFLVGPPVIGLISQFTSLRIGLVFVVVLSLLAASLVGWAGLADD